MFFLFSFLSQCADPKIPKFPKKYRLRGSWSIPYQQIRESLVVYTDTSSDPIRQVEIKYEGVQRIVHVINNRTYTIQKTPFDHDSCLFNEYHGTGDTIHKYLPDNDDDSWVYDGERVILGRRCDSWKKSNIDDVENWFYIFYVDAETRFPVRLWQHGISIRSSHPTDYVFDIEDFGPTIDETQFLLPTNCHDISSGGPSKVTKYADDISTKLGDTPFSTYCSPLPKLEGTVPEEFSWRNVPGILTMPRDQATCGSCWAQAAATSISAQFALAGVNKSKISVAQINDCTWGHTNYGCKGGNTDEAFKFLADNKTILVPEEEYPYLGVVGKCQKINQDTTITKVGYVTDCYETPQRDEEQLKLALYQKGPLAVAILASLPSFTKYQGGVYNDPKCNSDAELDHCVLLTGWKKFGDDWAWEIQNSWSDTWGDKGYAYIKHGFANDCGITLNAFLPVVKVYGQ